MTSPSNGMAGGQAPHEVPLGWAPPPGSGPQWMPPQSSAPAVKPSPLPVEPREYPAFWRAPGVSWWKPVVAVVLGIVGFIVSGIVVMGVGLAVEAAVSGRDLSEVTMELGRGTITPITFLANSASLGLLVPLAFLVSRLVGQKGGWISSVVGGIRWLWLLKCFAVSFVAVAALIAVTVVLEGWGSLELSLRPGWWWLLIGIIVVTPFQAAGEEYLVRGLLNRAVASFVPVRMVGAVLGAVLSSVAFMYIHLADDIWLNTTYFFMGMLFSYLAWRTGGLEAAIAMHVANNLVAMLFLPFQDIGQIFDRSEGTGDPTVLLQLGLLGIAAVVIVRMARRSSIERVGPPHIVDMRR